MQVAFGSQSYQLRSLPLGAQRMVNQYMESAPEGATSALALVQSYGIKDWATVGTGYLRGGAAINGRLYVVAGPKLYRLDKDGASTELGTIPGSHFVSMAADETHIMLVTDGLGYYWDGASVTRITDPDFPGAEWVITMDGYFIIGVADSQQIQISSNRDPAAWNGLDFASAEQYPDNLVGAIVDHREIILFGRESMEVFWNSGNADFPFERTTNGNAEIGLLSRFALCKTDNGVFFVGSDGIIYRLNGYKPERVSTHAIEQAIEDQADKTCFAVSWTEAGHKFCGFSFDTTTVVYDAASQRWHERQSHLQSRWRPLFIARVYDKWLVGDFFANRVGEFDPEVFSEFNETLRSSATSAPIAQENKRIAHYRLELEFETGVGLSTGQGSDPQVMLRWSNDRGRTWSNEHWRSLGRMGRYGTRAIWNRVGSSRGRIYEYAITDPVRRTLIGANMNAQLRDTPVVGRTG
jgi:hypothetical protein